MAITAYTGPPGAGKSYAMVSQVILPGYRAGRRVLTNIDGVNPDAFRTLALTKGDDPDKLGEIVLFHGDQAKVDGFWPTELHPTGRFVRPGDLVVLDEWALYFPRKGKMPTDELVGFMRYHRHLTAEIAGREVACDLVIGTQLITDVPLDFRGLIESSYKFKKLTGVGLTKAFVWDLYEGHTQPKGGRAKPGNGTYKAEIFDLYSSYQGGKGATEMATDSRRSIVGKWLYGAVAVGLGVVAWASWALYGFFTAGSGPQSFNAVAGGPTPAATAPAFAAAPRAGQMARPGPSTGLWRIVGVIYGDAGARVIVASRDGATRVLDPNGFSFDGDRPISGSVDGERVIAEDFVQIDRPAPQLPMPGVIQ